MGEAIIFFAFVNVAIATTFVVLMLAVCKWCRIGTVSWVVSAAALHAHVIASLLFNLHFYATGEVFGLGGGEVVLAALRMNA